MFEAGFVSLPTPSPTPRVTQVSQLRNPSSGLFSCLYFMYCHIGLHAIFTLLCKGMLGISRENDLLRNGNCFHTAVTEEHKQLSPPQKARAGKFRGEHLTSQSLETIGRLLPLMSTTAHWLREEEKDVTVGEFER